MQREGASRPAKTGRRARRAALIGSLMGALLLTAAGPAAASNSWGGWHWARSANPFTLKVLNSTSDSRTPVGGQNWPTLLSAVAADWSQSTVLDLALQPQSVADQAARAACAPSLGFVRVCNAENPDVTWLGLATVYPSVTGGGSHVEAATAQVNDSWFDTPLYNATNARQVLCQEVGHTFGLDHQDTSGKDLNTCMDYATALDNPSPGSHDFQQLQTIYSHLDSAGAASSSKGRSQPKKAVLQLPPGFHGTGNHSRGHTSTFVREVDGRTVLFNVIWAY